MKKLISLLLFFCFSAHLLEAAATIIGTVTDAVTGLPVSGALVEAVRGGSVRNSTMTVGDGTYILSDIEPSSYTLIFSASGYQTQSVGVNPKNNETTIVNAQLVPNGGAIAGTVIDATTLAPIPGAIVQIFQGTTLLTTVATDGGGNYTAANLAPGTYIVLAKATGYQAQVKGAQVQVAVTTVVDFALNTLPGSIQGTVTDAATTAPIRGATITVFDGSTIIGFADTDSSGDYTVPDLAPGNYIVEAQADGYQSQVLGAIVIANSATIVNFALSPNPGALTGTVTDAATLAPIAGATINVYDNVVIIATAITDPNGHYQISNLTPGDYTVTASQTSYQTQVKTASIVSNGTTVVNFALSSHPGSITGTVTNSVTTAPLSGALVGLFQNMMLVGFTRTDSNGQYSLLNLAPGTYTVVAIAPGFQAAFSAAVVTANNVTVVDLALVPFPSIIQGIITDACTGAPIAGAIVLATDGQTIVGFDVTDTGGAYVIASLAPGTYLVRVFKRNYVVGSATVSVAANSTETTNFSLIPVAQPPAFISGRVICNNYLTQTDIIHEISWFPSPSGCISSYLVLKDGVHVARILPSQLFKFVTCIHACRAVTYTVQAVNSLGQVSVPATICL